jgi:hypothetical protein
VRLLGGYGKWRYQDRHLRLALAALAALALTPSTRAFAALALTAASVPAAAVRSPFPGRAVHAQNL